MTSFQTQVNGIMGAAVEGDFASANPRYSALAGPGGLVAGTSGAIIGRFAWLGTPNDVDGGPTAVNNTGSGTPDGLIPREQQALITTYLAGSGMTIPAGFAVDVLADCDLWIKNTGAGAVTRGMKAFANTADGTAQFAAAGATVAGAVETAWYAQNAAAAGELVKVSRVI